VPRFDMTLRRGEARLRTRAPLPLALGSLDALELVAGELGGPLDLRAGALALRDRRTHAVTASLSLSVRALEQALRALGLPVGLHAGALSNAGVFGATLWLEDGPVDCEARGALDAGVLTLRLERFASTLPREGLAAGCGAALRQLEWTLAARGTPLHVGVDDDAQRLTLTIDHALEALLAGGLLAAGWRLPRTRGLAGTLRFRDGDERGGATLTLLAQDATSLERETAADGHSGGSVQVEALDAVRPHEHARHRLAELLEEALAVPLDVARAKRLFDAYAALEPSPFMCADAALTLAELLCVCELAGDVSDADTDITQLALRALGSAGRSPHVAARVLGLALRSRAGSRDPALLNALLASPLPAAQQAALIADAIPDLARESPVRARAWLERVRPFVMDLPQLRVAEAALLDAERVSDRAPESLGHAQERAAASLATAGRSEQAAGAFAQAARAYQQARDAAAAARCWVACVTSVPADSLALEWIIPGASALQLAGRTQDALALLATLLTRDASGGQHEALAQALEAAARFHGSLPPTVASPELFLARRRDLPLR
jgi:tetratricopeptide (TPR) repeat protein